MPSQQEQSPQHLGKPHIGWIESEEGLELRVVFTGIHRDGLSAEACHRLHQAYERLTAIVSMLIEDEERMQSQGRILEGSLSFLAAHLTDVTSFFQMLAGDLGPTKDDDFPF